MANQPSGLDSLEYRRTMGLFATGVTILVTRTSDGEPIGMTANSLTSVSLDPLLLLVCVAKDAHILPHLQNSDTFSLSILTEDQVAISDYFAGLYRPPEPPPFTFEEWKGGLRLTQCIGAIGCQHYAIHDGGDHWIVVGSVISLYRAPVSPDPLVFYAGKYRRLAPGEQDHL
jgi:flavin reductase (DIM6/NTAB) family NADH-FMN oxidoreductase RutF